jgi:hypothetical protein
VECAEQLIRDELPAWRHIRATGDIALRKARWELEMAESELGYAEADSHRPILGLPATVANQIKSRRYALQDLEDEISALVQEANGPPTRP